MSSNKRAVKLPMDVLKVARSSPAPGTSSLGFGNVMPATGRTVHRHWDARRDRCHFREMQANVRPMSDRPYNFSAGPAILPGEVFERCSAAVKQLNLPGDKSLES